MGFRVEGLGFRVWGLGSRSAPTGAATFLSYSEELNWNLWVFSKV